MGSAVTPKSQEFSNRVQKLPQIILGLQCGDSSDTTCLNLKKMGTSDPNLSEIDLVGSSVTQNCLWLTFVVSSDP